MEVEVSGAEYDNAKQKTEIVGEWGVKGKGEGWTSTPDPGVSCGLCSKAGTELGAALVLPLSPASAMGQWED